MIVLYTVLVAGLGALRFLTQSRATALERKYSRLALTVEKLANQAQYRPGNSNRLDVCRSAKAHFELGRLVDRRDRLEARHFAWQKSADGLHRVQSNLKSCKGRRVPYLMGAADVASVFYAADRLGLGTIDLSRLTHLVQSWLAY